VGIQSTVKCSNSDDMADVKFNATAYRSLHFSKPALLAAPSTVNPATGKEPITTIAQRESNQLSLEQPQNKAGMFP
jgi:hypothetical protein